MKTRLDPTLQAWVEARRRHHLSHAHVQMARELGMNPKKLGSLDNHRQQPWKLPLPEFIESLYEKRFGRTRPEVILSIEERAAAHARKQSARRVRRQEAKANAPRPGVDVPGPADHDLAGPPCDGDDA